MRAHIFSFFATPTRARKSPASTRPWAISDSYVDNLTLNCAAPATLAANPTA